MKKNMNGVYQLSTGKELVFRYDYVWCFIEGLAKVRLNGKYGYVDTTGKEVVPCKYDYVWDFIKGLARVQLNGKYGYVDKAGKVVIDYIYEDGTEQNSCGFAAVKKDGVWGSINKVGAVELEPSVNLDSNIYTTFIGKWHLNDSGLYYEK